MPRLEDEPILRIHLSLFARDIERVDALWAKSLGRSKAIRLLVRKMLDTIEAKAMKDAKHPKGPEILEDEILE